MRAQRIEGSSEERFWPKVDIRGPEECWPWLAAHRADGYGVFGLTRGHLVAAHRFSYTLSFGEIEGDLWVLHKCDNKTCVNPAHLFVGTRQDNVDDMVTKRRHWAHKGLDVAARGEDVSTAKLRTTDIPVIRERYAQGVTISQLGRDYGVSRTAIRLIIVGKNWKHV